MKVVLIQEVPELGIPGDVKDVKDGYARNYLLPQRLAVAATAGELARADSLRKGELARRERLNNEMASVAEQLESEPLIIEARTGPGGRLYGSITSAEIAVALQERIGQEVDRRSVLLPQPLKETGDHQVRVRLAPDVIPTITVSVKGRGAPTATATPAPEGTEPTEQEGAPPAE